MKRVPHSRDVSIALRSVRMAVQKALKGLNGAASQRMARGDYETAEALATKAKELLQFQTEVEVVRNRWQEVCGGRTRGTRRGATPLWGYYQPILQALVQAGGECRRKDLEIRIEQIMSASLQPGDREEMSRGRERWRVMVQRARRGLISEGWIADQAGALWRVTDAGRRAATKVAARSPEPRI